MELLDALSFETSADKSLYLYYSEAKEYSSRELLEGLKKHCKDLDEVFDTREEKTNALIDTYIDKIKKNEALTPDERTAWLGNVAVMRDYYLQYITNESAYDCALNALADKIHKSHIEEVTFSLGRNYGLVFSHLVDVLRDYRPPYDATMEMLEKEGEDIGRLDMNRK